MAETKIYIPDSLDAQLREVAMKRFGYGRGSISKAVETAIVQWLAREDAIKGAITAVVEKAKRDKNVIAVLLFGSYAKRDVAFRDVDLAILLKDPAKSDIMAYDHAIMDRGALYKVNVDVVALNNMRATMQAEILNNAVVLYSVDDRALRDYCIRIMMKQEDARRISAILAK